MNDLRGPLSVDKLDAAVDLMGRSGRSAILPMQGDSMLPMLRSGQLVAVDLSPARLERGDLLLFRQVDYLVVHRLLGPASREDGNPSLRTRGDGCLALDPPVDRDRVRGKVVAFERDGEWWDLESGGARLYAIVVALHDLAWAAAGAIGGRIDAALRKLGLPARVQSRVAWADRAMLGLAHRLFFEFLHGRSSRRPGGFREGGEPSADGTP